MEANTHVIREHLDFFLQGLSEYDDGYFEIAYGNADNVPNLAEKFRLNELEKAVEFIAEKNNQGRNVYLACSILDPESPPFGRCADKDFYVTNVIWCDIDAPVTVEKLKSLYQHLPPAKIVITGRTPHLRAHLWWKLSEPVTDADVLREALSGVCAAMGGDRAVCNPSRLMRVAGTVAWPKKQGRVKEMTELITPANATPDCLIDRIIDTYKTADLVNYQPLAHAAQGVTHAAVGAFTEKITDGRDKYMSDMIFAAIINLTGDLRRWPTPQEVMNDAWPVYAEKAAQRGGRTLDQDGRGQKLMASKIRAKLGLFQRGRMYGLESIEAVMKAAKSGQRQAVNSNQAFTVDADTGEIIERTETALLPYTWAADVKPRTDANDFVEGLLGENQFSIVYGESNCGKTFFMTDLAFHVALGRQWRGRRVDAGGVVYVALEGGFGLHNRIAAFKAKNPEAANMPFAIITTQIDFLDPDGRIKAFIETIKDVAAKVGNVRLVVIDTLSRAISGGDENSSQDMGKLISHADMIRAATDAHVCFVHHSGKDRAKGARGHSSLRAAVDTEIEIFRGEDDDYSTVKIAKQRDMEIGGDMYFSLERVTIGVNRHNEEVTSCVVAVLDDPQEKATKGNDARLTDIQQFVYDQILNILAETGKDRITYGELADRLEAAGWREKVPADKVKDYTKAVRVGLRKKNKIGFDGDEIWLLK